MMRRLFAGLVLLSLSGCATLITGPNQKVPVTSDPSDASVLVDSKDTYTTPAKLRLKRNHDHVLVFSKEGYLEETVKLTHTISGAIAGNTVLFGLAGLAIDNLSGAQFKLLPTSVHVNMKRAHPEPGS
jgi:uncharacterized protein with ATP-grasp and redox domains